LQPRSAPVFSSGVQISVAFPGSVQTVLLSNGSRLPTQPSPPQAVNPTQYTVTIPAANLQSLRYATGVTSPPTYFFTYVPLTANALAYDPLPKLIYCSVPSTAPRFGASIVAINPDTGDFEKNVFIGSEPNQLALSETWPAFNRICSFPLDQGQTQT
jgi:hypothetical protein